MICDVVKKIAAALLSGVVLKTTSAFANVQRATEATHPTPHALHPQPPLCGRRAQAGSSFLTFS